jgi:hypothetical protein
MSRNWAPRALVAFLVLGAFALAFVLTPPRGVRSMREFNPPRLANLEVRVWQAHYAKHRTRLFARLVILLHEQYHYSWATATLEGFHLARAAATFGDLRDGYDVVLPDLEAAFAKGKSWMHAEFEPRAVARAELAWWVARRVPGQNSAEQIGGLIADEYALLYETTRARVADAALLRAQAASLRNAQAGQPDWDRIARLLLQSYSELRSALSSEAV